MFYPDELNGLSLHKAESYIIEHTIANKNAGSSTYQGRFSRSEALHVKYGDYGSALGRGHTAHARAVIRLNWTEMYLQIRYGMDEDEYGTSAIKMLDRARKLHGRIKEYVRTLVERGPAVDRLRMNDTGCIINSYWANAAISRMRERMTSRHKQVRQGLGEMAVSVTSNDVMTTGERDVSDNSCPVLGLDLVINHLGGPADASPSVHRVDAARGYHPDNIAIISSKANSLIGDRSSLELTALADYYVKEEDERAETYRALAAGQAALEETCGVTPRARESFQHSPQSWFHMRSGEMIYAASV